MNLGRIAALTVRIIRQFRRDPRTLGLLFVVPVVILSLLGYIYRGSDSTLLLGISGDADSSQAAAIVSLLEEQQRVDTVALGTESPTEAMEQQSVDGVLALPESESFANGSTPPFILYLEGSDPARSGQLLETVQQVIPRFALQEIVGMDSVPITTQPEFIYGGSDFDQLDFLAPVFMGFFAFFFVFLLTSVSFLRERMQGSIERLLVSPISRPEIVTGYMLGFSIFAAIQSALIIMFSIFVLDIHHIGNIGYVFLITMLLTLGAVNLGIFLSTFARTELQVVQFIPVVIVPQGLLSGMIWPIDSLPEPLRWLAHTMPLTWANEALRDIMIRGAEIADIQLEIGVLAGFAVLLVVLGSLTLRRDVA
jgi:ABC-2 type transport system permease protein